MGRFFILPGFLVACALLAPGAAHADGTFVWRNEAVDIREPEQKALLCFDGSREELVLSVRFEGASEDFGWIVPVPSRPELHAEDARLFELLSRGMQGHQYVSSALGRMATASSNIVRILGEETVGVYRAVTLAAGDGAALGVWLREHGYRIPQGGDRILDGYARRGWSFVTLRIDPSALSDSTSSRLASGTIPPIRIGFAADRPVFPLEISALGGAPSLVLLYLITPELMVPRSADPVAWETRILTSSRLSPSLATYESPDGTRPLAAFGEGFHLSKHRRTFRPEEMRDVLFEPYDALRMLDHPDEDTRLEAVAHLSMTGPPGAQAALIAHLDGAAGREAGSAMFALGEIGGGDAERAILGRLDGDDPDELVEGSAALIRMKSGAAVPRFLELLARFGSPDLGSVGSRVRTAWLNHVVSTGDSAVCVPALAAIAEAADGFTSWRRVGTESRYAFDDFLMPGGDGELGMRAVVALASFGVERAHDVLLESLVAGGRAMEPDRLRQAAIHDRASVNGFPSGYWGALGAMKSFAIPRWQSFSLFSRMAPASLRDPMLREAMDDPRLSMSARVFLTAGLTELTPDDVDRLHAYWDRSMRDPVRLEVPDPDRAGATFVVRNHDAGIIAHAFGQLGRIEDLLTLAGKCPPDDPELRGEIIHALARARDPRAEPVILEYVHDVWDSAARAASFGDRVPGGPSPAIPFDRRYRVRAIGRFLDHTLEGVSSEEMQRRFLGEDWAPWIRYWFLTLPNYHEEGSAGLAAVARREATRMREDAADDPRLVALLDRMLASLDRADGPRAGGAAPGG